MQRPDSLRRRIVVAFLLFGFVSSLFFAAIAVVSVEGIEVHLVDNRLAEVAAWASPRQSGGLPIEMPAGISFHRGAAIPLSLQGLEHGVHEVHVDGTGLHVLSGADAAGEYVVVDHESDYERVEVMVYSTFALAFLGLLAFAALLGSFVARRIVTPITALANAVGSGAAQQLPLLDRSDELGTLARALESHTCELRAFLDRERFFTGDVSHELRSPLTVVMGAAEILLTQDHGDDVRLPAERIYRAAQEASECINVLLLLARAPELAQMPAIDVGALAAEETERHRPLVAGKAVVLSFEGGSGFSVAAPPELCAAAIGNLVRNACQYTERGQVTVRLGERTVSVEDTGPGLPDAVRAVVMAATRPAPSKGSAGTGLGLALVQRICEYLGASLGYAERAGGGSIFTIHFPGRFTKS
ncbi:MAG: sensor histidine kinase [Telluria sp.]